MSGEWDDTVVDVAEVLAVCEVVGEVVGVWQSEPELQMQYDL